MAAGGGPPGQSIWDKLTPPITVASGIAAVLFLIFDKLIATVIFVVLTFVTGWFWLHPIVARRIAPRGSFIASAVSLISVVCALLIGLLLGSYLIPAGPPISSPTNGALATSIQAGAPTNAAVAQNPTAQPNPITQVVVTQVGVTQVAVTQIAVTQVAITQVAVTEIVATGEPILVTAAPEPTPTVQPDLIFKDTFDNGVRPDWKVLADQPLTVDGRLTASTQKLTMQYGDTGLKNFAIDFDLNTGGASIVVMIGGQLRLLYEQGYGTKWFHLVNGNWQYLATTPNIGDAQHVRIEVKGSTYTVDRNNGQQKSDISASIAGQGPIQLIIDKGCFVDNFTITTLP